MYIYLCSSVLEITSTIKDGVKIKSIDKLNLKLKLKRQRKRKLKLKVHGIDDDNDNYNM